MFKIVFNDDITNCKSFFKKCTNIISFDLSNSNFNTSNIIDMEDMFSECHKLKEIKGINNFITNKVTAMNQMFQQCNELEYLDLTNFNTANVTDMSFMFNFCHKLKYLNVSNFLINCATKNMFKFNKKECKFIANDKKLKQLYNSS